MCGEDSIYLLQAGDTDVLCKCGTVGGLVDTRHRHGVLEYPWIAYIINII